MEYIIMLNNELFLINVIYYVVSETLYYKTNIKNSIKVLIIKAASVEEFECATTHDRCL